MRRVLATSVFLLLAWGTATTSCGGTNNLDGDGGGVEGGTNGTAGTAGTGGAAGSSGTYGAAGSNGVGGTYGYGGSYGVGGASGYGGTGGVGGYAGYGGAGGSSGFTIDGGYGDAGYGDSSYYGDGGYYGDGSYYDTYYYGDGSYYDTYYYGDGGYYEAGGYCPLPDGAPPLPLSAPCLSCVQFDCCATYTTCLGDPGCVAIEKCAQLCITGGGKPATCELSCFSAADGGIASSSAANALTMDECLGGTCALECGF